MEKYNEQLSYLKRPSVEEIPPELQEYFDDNIKKQEEKLGVVNNLFKVLPLNSIQFKAFLDFMYSLFNTKNTYLNVIEKEMIGLVVSSINCCNYCLTTHSDALRGLTKDPVWVDQLTYNYRSAKLTDKQRALCDYAFRATKYADEITTKEVDLLRMVGFTDNEILEAAFVVGFFNYTNRWVSTIGAIPNPKHYSNNR